MRLGQHPVRILFSILPALLLLCCGMNVLAGDTVLTWGPSPSENIIGYKVYAGTTSRIYNAPITVGNQTEYAVAGLTTGTWYFAVTAVDIAGNESDYSNEVSIVIGSTTDTTPPVISGINVSGIGTTGATIRWTTNEAANTRVDYGTTTDYNSFTFNGTMETSHSQLLSGLSAGTVYHYRVRSTDGAGNQSVSPDYTFTTTAPSDTTAPVISGVSSKNITSTGAAISWTTNEASSSQIEYGTATSYGKSSALSSSMVTAHTQTLSGLSPDTLYHYRVKSADAAGNPAASGDFTFKTPAPPDTTPPVISNISSSNLTDAGATITWATDEGASSQVEYGTTTAYGKSTTLNSSMVTTHSQALSGLSADTLYHYRVKSADAAGNAAVSGDNTFTTPASTEPDSSRFARWFRSDEVQDEAGNKHSSGPLGSHASVYLEDNPAFPAQNPYISYQEPLSALRMRIQPDKTPPPVADVSQLEITKAGAAPVLGSVSISEVAGQSARISWTTDKPGNSEVEYWAPGETVSKAVLGEFETQHSITLNSLKKGTRYQFSVKSANPDGKEAKSAPYSFTTTPGSNPVVALPRFFDLQDQNEMGEEVFEELALTNLGNQPAALTLTAMDEEGNVITGQNIVNPGRFQVAPRAQSAALDMDIFGEGMGLSGARGWIKVESSTPDLGGFSLAFGGNLNLADGTGWGDVPLTDFAFTEIAGGGTTRINVTNGNPSDATVQLELVKADGTVRSSQYRVIKANGALVADLFGEIFPEIAPDATNYVRAHSTKGVMSFELMKRESGDIASLAGQDITAGATVLYSPHYVTGNDWKTALSVINLDAKAGKVRFQFVGENGVQIGEARVLEIPANGKLYLNAPSFFGQAAGDKTYTGYVKISSDGVRLAGSTEFVDSSGTSFSSALPLVYQLQKSVLYGHAVSNDLYRSGIAIVNPNDADFTASLELHAADGTCLEKRMERIPAGRRVAKLLTEYFPSRAGQDQTSGYIKITSAKPFASFYLFGTENLSLLSAIPAKPIP